MTRIEKQFAMPEQKLIKAVKAHDVLYNKAKAGYKNKLLKQEAWDKISTIVGLDVEYCQQRWRSLRDRFVKEIGKNSESSSTSDEAKWIHLDSMEFIRTHVAPRKRFKTINNEVYVISPYTADSCTSNADMSLDVGSKRNFSFEDENSVDGDILANNKRYNDANMPHDVDDVKDNVKMFSFDDENSIECHMPAHKKRHTGADMSPDMDRSKKSRMSSFLDESFTESHTPANKKRKLTEISTRIDKLVGVVENLFKQKPNTNSENGVNSHSEFFAMLEKMFNKLPEEKKERVKYKIYTFMYQELE